MSIHEIIVWMLRVLVSLSQGWAMFCSLIFPHFFVMIQIHRDNLLPLSLFIYAKQILFILGTDQIQHRRFSKVSNFVCNHSPGTFM